MLLHCAGCGVGSWSRVSRVTWRGHAGQLEAGEAGHRGRAAAHRTVVARGHVEADTRRVEYVPAREAAPIRDEYWGIHQSQLTWTRVETFHC